MGERCSAIVWLPAQPGFLPNSACRNGFPVTGSCHGTAGTPMCLKEEWCGRVYEANGGKPKPLDE